MTKQGGHVLIIEGHRYHKNRENQYKVFWKCSQYKKFKCPATAVSTKCGQPKILLQIVEHTHL